MTTREAETGNQARRIAIGGLSIVIECRTAACLPAVSALTHLFSESATSDATGRPMLHFGLHADDGLFRLTLNGEMLWQGENAGETVAAFEFQFYNHVIQALFPPLLSLHAATVLAGGHLFTFAGSSGAGKSSLCTAALLAGARYFSDEFTLLDEGGAIHPFPRPLQWDGGAHPAFTEEEMRSAGFGQAGYRFPGHDGVPRDSLLWQPPHVARKAAPIAQIFLPQYAPDAPSARLEALPRAQGIMELAAHVHQHLDAGERIRLLHQRLPASVSIYRLTFSDCRAAWRAARALAETPPAAVRVSP